MSVHPSEEDIELLQTYDWPGNIRELGAVIDRAAILGNGKRLEIAVALGFIGDRTPLARNSTSGDSLPPSVNRHSNILSLDDAMRAHIETVLVATEGRIEGRRGAAALLKINPHTLRARMRKLSIDWSKYRPATS